MLQSPQFAGAGVAAFLAAPALLAPPAPAHPITFTGGFEPLWHRHACPAPERDRRVAALLFTDIVGSTVTAARIGNRRWADLLQEHDERTCAEVRRCGGEVIDLTGDGVFALFDWAGQAIRCAAAVHSVVRTLHLEIRAGVHLGEVEIRHERVAGLAVHIAARIAALARGGEILISRPVRDLLGDSELKFIDRGVHTLRGVPARWPLYSVALEAPDHLQE